MSDQTKDQPQKAPLIDPIEWDLNVVCERHLLFGELYEEANRVGNAHAAAISAAGMKATSMQDAATVAAVGDRFLYSLRASVAAALGVVGAITEPGCSVEVNITGIANGVWITVQEVEAIEDDINGEDEQ